MSPSSDTKLPRLPSIEAVEYGRLVVGHLRDKLRGWEAKATVEGKPDDARRYRFAAFTCNGGSSSRSSGVPCGSYVRAGRHRERPHWAELAPQRQVSPPRTWGGGAWVHGGDECTAWIAGECCTADSRQPVRASPGISGRSTRRHQSSTAPSGPRS